MEDEYERPSDISNGDITGSDISTSNSSKNGTIKMIDLQRQADSKSYIQGQLIYRYHWTYRHASGLSNSWTSCY